MDRKEEQWLHQYRKLSRDSNPFRHCLQSSTNFTDSRLKFKRSLIFLLKQLYLSLQNIDSIDKQRSFPLSSKQKQQQTDYLKLIEHLIKTNVFRKWDIYILNAGQEFLSKAQSRCDEEIETEIQDDFIQMVQYAYLQVFPWGQNMQFGGH